MHHWQARSPAHPYTSPFIGYAQESSAALICSLSGSQGGATEIITGGADTMSRCSKLAWWLKICQRAGYERGHINVHDREIVVQQ